MSEYEQGRSGGFLRGAEGGNGRGGEPDVSRGREGPYGTSHWGKDYGNARRMNDTWYGSGRGPKGYIRPDERLREEISEQLMSARHIDSSEVTVEVRQGKVILAGTVPERWMKHAIEDTADGCPGVQDIENNIRVNREGTDDGR
jgi:hypothetical protein